MHTCVQTFTVYLNMVIILLRGTFSHLAVSEEQQHSMLSM